MVKLYHVSLFYPFLGWFGLVSTYYLGYGKTQKKALVSLCRSPEVYEVAYFLFPMMYGLPLHAN